VIAKNRQLNRARYAALLAEALPAPITGEQDYERMLALAERLIDKGEGKTREEGVLLSLVGQLIEAYEAGRYDLPGAAPVEVLRHLMEERGLTQADLLPVFKSRGYVSDVLSGARPINAGKARALAEFFGVSPALFI
jgi:HTH-type transcriptional regulator/antitoxin HigA